MAWRLRFFYVIELQEGSSVFFLDILELVLNFTDFVVLFLLLLFEG
jgi:hypothetical protein